MQLTIVCEQCRHPLPLTKQLLPDVRGLALGYVLIPSEPRCPHCGAFTQKEDE